MPDLDQASLLQRVGRSIAPLPTFRSDGTRRRRFLLSNLALHFRPVSVPLETLRFSLSWGLGGMAATLILVQFATGVLMKFAYVPTPADAYASVQWIVAEVPFGGLVRNLHHWCSHLLIAVAVLHMLRVFLTGAFHPPRQFNWIVGLVLLTVVLGANFTGYLLPWDQLAYWAVTVSTGMLDYLPIIGNPLQGWIREGGEIGPVALQVFFSLHTAVIPVLLAALMAFHFWRVRKAGGLVVAQNTGASSDAQAVRVPSVPDLLLREFVTALALVAVVLLASALFDAPLGDPANPGLSPNPTRAPWYFAGLQELLLHLHPQVAVCLIPILVVCGLLAIPYLNYESDTGGIWLASRKGRVTGGVAALVACVVTPVLILADERIHGGLFSAAGLPSIVGNGLIPIILLAVGLAGFYWILRKHGNATRNEAVQAIFILLLTAYGVLTIVGVWFRGPGMVLISAW